MVKVIPAEEFKDTQGVIKIHKSKKKKNRQRNGQNEKVQKNKKLSTKHYTENIRSSDIKAGGGGWRTHVLRKCKQYPAPHVANIVLLLIQTR